MLLCTGIFYHVKEGEEIYILLMQIFPITISKCMLACKSIQFTYLRVHEVQTVMDNYFNAMQNYPVELIGTESG